MSERDYWGYFVGEARRIGSPLYVRLAEGIGGDTELKAIAENTRARQPPANLILGAVHFLLLRGAEHDLRRYYPTLHGGQADDGDAFPAFRDFVLRNRETVAAIVATRITNTNEVGRSAALHAGFRVLAEKAGAPLHLVEIGPSAGLNLIWDRYRVRYSRGAEHFLTGGEADGSDPLVIDARLEGDGVPPLGPAPQVVRRLGLERNPVDLADPDQRDWLRALVWPDNFARFTRLEKALVLYAGVHPEIRAGDALALLPEALAEAPKDVTLCVYHTVVTYQFTHEMREALDHILVAAGLRRAVWRLSLEWAGAHDYPLTLARYEDGTKTETMLALCDPHGAWIEWMP